MYKIYNDAVAMVKKNNIANYLPKIVIYNYMLKRSSFNIFFWRWIANIIFGFKFLIIIIIIIIIMKINDILINNILIYYN